PVSLMLNSNESFYDEGMGEFTRPYQVVSSGVMALIRDNVEEKKVYVVFMYNGYFDCPANVEHVLYDFSLTKGDQLTGCTTDFYIDSFNPQPLIIDSVFLYDFEEESRKTLRVEGVIPLDELPLLEPLFFIEGIGLQTWGIFFTYFPPALFSFSGLVDYCIGTDADCGIVTNIEENLYQQGFALYPTLIQNDSFCIESSLSKVSLHIYDLTGREVVTYLDIDSNKELIELERALGKGMYVVKVVDSRNQFIGTEHIILH
ncbi:MAG: T9SS type A sorting domain-containing protein, partial [Chitinophagales bacterium]